MPLSTAERPINIKDLILEEPSPERELPFDPEKEITEEDWQRMKTRLSKYLHRYKTLQLDWKELADLGMNMALLFPNRREELHLDQDLGKKMCQEFHQRYTTWLSDSLHSYSIPEDREHARKALIEAFYALKVLFPDQARTIDIRQLLGELQKELQDEYDIGGEARSSRRFFEVMYDLKLLSPEQTQIPHLDAESLENAKRLYDGHRRNGIRESLVNVMQYLKVLFPDTDVFACRDEDWDYMRGILRHYQAKGYHDVSRYALLMKMLAAEEVRVTEKGLEITMRKPRTDFAPLTPPLPEVRRF